MPAGGNAWDQAAKMVEADSITAAATDNLQTIIDNDRDQLSNAVRIVGNAANRGDAARTLRTHFLDVLDDPRPEGGESFERLAVVELFTVMLGAVDWFALTDHYMEKWNEGVR